MFPSDEEEVPSPWEKESGEKIKLATEIGLPAEIAERALGKNSLYNPANSIKDQFELLEIMGREIKKLSSAPATPKIPIKTLRLPSKDFS